jgi:uncharacterized membrane protein
VKTPLKGIHLIVGLLALVTFLLTGQYMRYHIHHLMEADERLRFSLRGNHIYILLSALMNLCLGAYLRASFVKWRAYTQLVGSLLVVAATFAVVAAFFFESKASLERPVTLLAMVLALAGTLLHVVATARSQLKD